MNRHLLRASCGMICALAIACADRPQLTVPAAGTVARAMGLSLVADRMVQGSAAEVRGLFHRPDGKLAVGSFTVRVSYDTTRLVFDHDATTGGGLRIMNARDGVLTIAGASSAGFGGDTLFAASFRVTGADAAKSITLDIVEMHSVGFGNIVPSLDARGGIRPARMPGIVR